ncbi:hypothetical protein K0651_08395 [Ornithinimicrobium sp. Arc0846-15]|nr:hypothetical protein [Ornithinimicrobium laminariae]
MSIVKKQEKSPRTVAYLFTFVAAVAAAQIVLVVPQLGDSRTKVSLLLALPLLVISVMLATRSWIGSREE